MKILVDANVALDVILNRQPFYQSSASVIGLSQGGIDVFISASTITDLYYITNKSLKDKQAALTLIKNLLNNVVAASVTDNEIRRAINLNWNDFEDAVQYSAGEAISVDYLVTRNVSDFSASAYPVVTPDDLLNILINNP